MRPEAARLGVEGHLGVGRMLADAVRRIWWPIALVASMTRTGRRVVVAAVLPVVWEALASTNRQRSRREMAEWLGLRLADDIAYGAGVWAGAIRARRAGAVLPRLTR